MVGAENAVDVEGITAVVGIEVFMYIPLVSDDTDGIVAKAAGLIVADSADNADDNAVAEVAVAVACRTVTFRT